MSGSGGASSATYPAYLKGVHEMFLKGGTISYDKDDVKGSAAFLSSSDSILDSVKKALTATTPYAKDDIKSNPFADRPTATSDSFMALLADIKLKDSEGNNLDSLDTRLTTSEIEGFVTEASKLAKLNGEFDFDSFFTEITERIASIDEITSTRAKASASFAHGASTTILSDLKEPVQNDVEDIITSAVSKIDAELTNMSLNDRVSSVEKISSSLTALVLGSIDAKITTVFNRMFSTVSDFSVIINDSVDAFEASISSKYQKAIGRLTVSMGQIGASTSSALASSLAELEEERMKDIQKYRIGLESDLRNKIYETYANSSSEISNAYQLYESYMKDRSSTLTSMVQNYVSSYVSNLNMLVSYASQVLSVSTQSADSMAKGVLNIEANEHAIYNQYENNNIRSLFDGLFRDKQLSDANASQYREFLMSTLKMSYIADKEYYDRKAEMYLQSVRWDLDTFAYVGNFMGSLGSSVVTKDKLTTTQSTMSNIAVGAAIGSQVGSIGGIPGAVVGAGVGAVMSGIPYAVDSISNALSN